MVSFETEKKPFSIEGRLIKLWYVYMVERELNYTGWDGKYATCSTKWKK